MWIKYFYYRLYVYACHCRFMPERRRQLSDLAVYAVACVWIFWQLLHKLFPSSRLLTTLTTWPLGGYIMIGIFFLLPIVVGLSINLETCEARWKHTNTLAIETRDGILIGLMCVLIFAYAIWGW